MLEADSIELSYKGRPILTDIYFRCDIGSVLGVTGRNGAGKTSLLKVVFGVVEPLNKCIRVNGKYVSKPFKIEGFIKYVPSNGYVFPYQTPSELAVMYGIPGHVLRHALEIEVVADNFNMKFGSMSFGIRKFTQMIITLYSNCQYIMLDDPFAGLSPILVETLIGHVIRQKKDKGIIIASSQTIILEKFADNILYLRP